MPGMMNTILNLGLNDETVEGLAAKSGNPRFAYDCYRRFIQMFGEVALDIDMAQVRPIFDARKNKVKAKLDTDLTAEDLKAIIDDYKKLVKKETKPFPAGPARAARPVARRRVPLLVGQGGLLPPDGKDSGRHRHRRQRAGHGVRQYGRHLRHRRRLHARSRHGRKGFLRRVPGQRAGRRRGGRHPHAAAHRDLEAGMPTPTTSFATSPPTSKSTTATCRISSSPSQEGKLFMLQTRNGKRTGAAAVRVAVEMVEEGLIDKKEGCPARRARRSSISCCIRCSIPPASRR